MTDIVTSSVDEGLDFAFNLVVGAIATAGDRDALKAQFLLGQVSQYVRLRYSGELRLAFEYLDQIDREIPSDIDFQRNQFVRQIDWLREALGNEDAQ